MPVITVVSIFSTIFIVFSLIACYAGLKTPVFLLNENQILYLYSTSAQVLAAVYGLTLTGFIFFRNELSREEFEDETLTEAVESLKERYFKILLFITVFSVFTLLISNLVISYSVGKNGDFSIILMNVAQASFITNLLAISYFIFDVIAPQRIEKASKSLQKLLDPYTVEDKGSLEDFLKNYNTMEYILQKYGQAYQAELEEAKTAQRRRISNVRLAEFILRAERIDHDLFQDIKRLITLRNSIIHGAEPVVSQEVVSVSERILRDLASALGVKI